MFGSRDDAKSKTYSSYSPSRMGEREGTNQNLEAMNEEESNSIAGGGGGAVISSLEKASFPYSSIAHSPDYRFAVVVGKNDKLQIISITNEDGLREWRSFRVSQHFRTLDTSASLSTGATATSTTTTPSGAIAGIQQPPTSSRGSAGSSNRSSSYYGDIRGLFVPPSSVTGGSESIAPTSPTSLSSVPSVPGAPGSGGGVGGGGANVVNLTDIAWSSSFSNSKLIMTEQTYGTGGGRSMEFGASESETDNNITATSSRRQVNQTFSKDNKMYKNIDSDSLIAAAGSNGVVVVWHAQTAFLGLSSALSQQARQHKSKSENNKKSSNPLPNFSNFFGLANIGGGGGSTASSSSGLGRKGSKNTKQDQLGGIESGNSSSAAPSGGAEEAFGQPEAILAEHSRAVNRVSFHPRKPYLLLTASQDASVKLWERRSQQQQQQQQQQQKQHQQSQASFSNPYHFSTTEAGDILTDRAGTSSSNARRSTSDEVSSSSLSTTQHKRHHSKSSGGGSGVLLSWFGVSQTSVLQPAASTEDSSWDPENHIPAQYTYEEENEGTRTGNNTKNKHRKQPSLIQKTNLKPPTWHCTATFQSNRNDAIRDIQWSPFLEHIFAVTTDSGYLIVFDSRVVVRPYFKVAAHSGECTSVDWHPTRPYVLATSGGRDRTVKIWDIEQGVSLGYGKLDLHSNNDNVNNSERGGSTGGGGGGGSIGKSTTSTIDYHNIATTGTTQTTKAAAAAAIAQHTQNMMNLNALSHTSTCTLSDHEGPSDKEQSSSDHFHDSPNIEPLSAAAIAIANAPDLPPTSFGSMGNLPLAALMKTHPGGSTTGTVLKRNLSEAGGGAGGGGLSSVIVPASQQKQQQLHTVSSVPRFSTYGRFHAQGSRERLGGGGGGRLPPMATNIYTLSIGSPVTKVQWRPSTTDTTTTTTAAMADLTTYGTMFGGSRHFLSNNNNNHMNEHDSMLAVSTAPTSGSANAFEKGSISLWTVHRPFLPLSLVYGHKEGAVADFFFLDTPWIESNTDDVGDGDDTITAVVDNSTLSNTVQQQRHLAASNTTLLSAAQRQSNYHDMMYPSSSSIGVGEGGRLFGITRYDTDHKHSIAHASRRDTPNRNDSTTSDTPYRQQHQQQEHHQEWGSKKTMISRRASLHMVGSDLSSSDILPRERRTFPSTDASTTIMSNVVPKKRPTNAVGSTSSRTGGMAIWQHVVSVGRDGRCLLQNLARGYRPLDTVPSCALAIAPLTPFSKHATGSLQLVSVHQNVPAGNENDFLLTGLRRDMTSPQIPTLFRDSLLADPAAAAAFSSCSPSFDEHDKRNHDVIAALKRSSVPPRTLESYSNTNMLPILNFSSIDKRSDPTTTTGSGGAVAGQQQRTITIAPELEHFSYFAKTYKLRADDIHPKRSDVCCYNASMAYKVNYESHGQMWEIIASILRGSQFDTVLSSSSPSSQLPPNDRSLLSTSNIHAALTSSKVSVLDYVLWPTLKNLLSERAALGDIQTCVVLCEIMGAIVPAGSSTSSSATNTNTSEQNNHGTGGSAMDVTSLIPGLDTQMIREWYLSYIEILHQHALFQVAAELMGNCRDPLVGDMSKNSTTFYESCPFCGKALQGATTYQHPVEQDPTTPSQITTSTKKPLLIAQRACGNCQNRVGLCFLCQTPVQELFVWCSGCGHGGHLHHAMEWFQECGQELCPTGCGHRCNLTRLGPFPTTSAFPIWQPCLQ